MTRRLTHVKRKGRRHLLCLIAAIPCFGAGWIYLESPRAVPSLRSLRQALDARDLESMRTFYADRFRQGPLEYENTAGTFDRFMKDLEREPGLAEDDRHVFLCPDPLNPFVRYVLCPARCGGGYLIRLRSGPLRWKLDYEDACGGCGGSADRDRLWARAIPLPFAPHPRDGP